MSSISYLYNLPADKLGDVARQYGVVGFVGTESPDFDKIKETMARGLAELSVENIRLETFFSTRISSDDSYESVHYEVLDFNERMSFVRIKKVITYKDFGHGPREKSEVGQIFPRSVAQKIVDALNSKD